MSTKIEFCDETLNPFWGCKNKCSYCQARRIAHMRAERIGKLRGYPTEVIDKMKRFEPVWLPDADRILAQIWEWKKPKTIFIGFMGDISYQKENDIEYIFDVIKVHPEHRFLILSKRTDIFWWKPDLPENCWIGGSVTNSEDRHNGFNAGGIVGILRNSFISFEPIIGKVYYPLFHRHTKLAIIGALTGRNGKPVSPDKGGTKLEWVLPIIEKANQYNIPVFLKDNLLQLYPQLAKRQELPWRMK